MKPFEISFLILKSISLSRTFAFCRERLLMISWVTPIWARICLPQTWRNRKRDKYYELVWGLVENKEVWHPFMTIRSAHTSHTTWSPHSNSRIFISLRQQLIKKEVRLQFYLNSNGTRYSFENLVLHLLAFFKIFSLFLTFLNKYNSFHCRLEKWNSHRTNDRFFGQRKAKAFVKSSVYFADRLMTSKRSRSLFFTAWKTSFRPPTTLEQKRKKKSSLHPSLQLQISWPWKSKEIVNLCTEKSVSHVT